MALLARVNEVAEADTRTFLGLFEWHIDVQARQERVRRGREAC